MDAISYRDEVVYPFIFAVLISTVFFRKKRKVSKRYESIFLLLGKSSYNIFLLHYGICQLLLKYCAGVQYKKIGPIYLLGMLFIGIIMEILLSKLKGFSILKGREGV